MTDPRVIQVITDARALIADPSDWSPKGTGTALFPASGGSRCVGMALQHALCRAYLPFEAFTQARELAYTLNGGEPLGTWNDKPGRTHAEVLALLDRMKEEASAA